MSRAAEFFDEAYYLRQVPELAGGDEAPLAHYLRAGASLGLDPHPLFWTSYYAERYARAVGLANPLEHFVATGWREGFDPNPFFDTSWYLAENADVANHDMNPVEHYATYGGGELDRSPHPAFLPAVYAVRRKLAQGTNPLVHFLERLRALRIRTAGAKSPLHPDASIVILNFNKAGLTLQSVVEVYETRGAGVVETIVVDNGSAAKDFAWLARWLPDGVRLIRLEKNRFFGEGNNIGAWLSRGRNVLFLNNDAFLEPDTLRLLDEVLERHVDAGAAGPKILFPDGLIQEAGGFVRSCGGITQRGRGLQNFAQRYAATEPVDYVSASCLLVPRRYLDEIAGFDLAFEPAYYEDVDLCMKLKLLGLKTYYCGAAHVLHIENATAGDASLGLALGDIIGVNREKFVARWGACLESGDEADAKAPLPVVRRGSPPDPRPLAILVTPYSLVPGGGERYLLTLAAVMSQRFRTVLATDVRYSPYRLAQMAVELDVDLSGVELMTEGEAGALGDCELYISIGNQVLPHSRGIGRRSLYVCQFPFPMSSDHVAQAWGWLETYDGVLTYSEFAAAGFVERAGRMLDRFPPVAVLPPPVALYEPIPSRRRPARILSVGRFTEDGHCKRQDVLVSAFAKLVKREQRDDLELHLVGTVPPDPTSRAYFNHVRRLATGFNVHLHPDAGPRVLRELYETASFYWHGTGFGQNESLTPELMEHFGCAVVEAMSAGAVPLVYAAGGLPQLVAHGAAGYHWREIEELVNQQSRLLASPELAARFSAAAIDAARWFDRPSFEARCAGVLRDFGVEAFSAREAAFDLR